jgi:Flp pilus assembly protein protease CpaA
MNFIFVLYLVGVLFAVFQDFKRREIDDWLNLFLFFCGVSSLLFSGDLYFNHVSIVEFGFFIFFTCMVSFILYHSRFFSGGDAKLFFAITPLFFSIIFFDALFNVLSFIVCLVLAGCVYSLIYSGILFIRDFRYTKKLFSLEIKKKYSKILMAIGVVFMLCGFFDWIFLFLGVFLFLFVLLISFAKSLENVSMKKVLSTRDLREGDWLFDDIKVGGRIFKKNWDGLREEEVNFLKKFNKKVLVKDGIPYAPAFFLALILYVFSDYLLGIIFS